ncbi:MAG: 6-bladed beta-propeller [Saprospiraceae bacterium]
MKLDFYLAHLLLLALIFGCSEPDSSQNDLTVIPVTAYSQMNVSAFFSTISYLPLKNRQGQAYLGEVRKMEVDEHGITFLQGHSSNDASICCFNADGSYKLTLNHFGEGPGEYSTLTDFNRLPNGDFLLLDQNGMRINQYNQEGTWIEKIPLAGLYYRMAFFPDGTSAMYKGNFPSADPNRLVFLDKDHNVVASYFPAEPYSSLFIIASRENFRKIQGSSNYLFNLFLDPVLYEVSPTTVTPKYRVDLGDNWLPGSVLQKLANNPDRKLARKLVLDQEDYVIYFNFFSENEKVVFLSYFLHGHLHWCLYNKSNQSTLNTYARTNNIDGSLVGEDAIWPVYLYNDEVVFVLQAPDVVSKLKNIAKATGRTWTELQEHPQNDFERLASQVNEVDNPVLAFAKLN